MTRSRRRRILTALLLLPWQAAVLAPGAWAALESHVQPHARAQPLTQVPPSTDKAIPAEVQGWFDAMKEQADKGNGAEALRMHERVMVWVRANLPERHVFRARVMVRYGFILSSMGKHKEALMPTQEAAKMLRAVAKINQEPDTRYFLTVSLYRLGECHAKLNQMQEALAAYQEALPTLHEQAKTRTDSRELLTDTVGRLGFAYFNLGQPEQGLTIYQEVLPLVRQRVKADPTDRRLAGILYLICLSHVKSKQYQQALAPCEEVAQKFSKQEKTDLNLNSILPLVLVGSGITYLKLGKIPQSIALIQEGLPGIREFAKNNPEARLVLPAALFSLGLSHVILNQSQKALPSIQESVTLLRESINVLPNQRELKEVLAYALLILGLTDLQLSPGKQMLAPMEEAVQIYRKLVKSNSASREPLRLFLSILGIQYSILGRRQEALSATQEATSMRSALPTTDVSLQIVYALCLVSQGFYLTKLGRPQEALAPGLEAVRLSRELSAANQEHQNLLALSLLMVGYHYEKLKQSRDVLTTAGEALRILRKLATNDISTRAYSASALNLVSQAYADQGQLNMALSSAREAIGLLRASSKCNIFCRAELALALKNQAEFLVEAGQIQQALNSAREAVEIDRSVAKANFDSLDQLSESTTTLATISIQEGQPAAAIPLLQEAVNSEVRFLQQQLPLMPEGRRQALVDTLGRRWEIPFSMAQQGDAGASLALYTRLNRHGLLQDIERRQAIISHSKAVSQALVARLSILNAQISNPTLSDQDRQNVLAESERLQEDLYHQLPVLQPRLVEIAEVAQLLPTDAVLVEFQRFSPYFAAKPEKEAWGKPRYLALLLDRHGIPQAIDLGDADALDQTIAAALDRTRFLQPDADRAWALVAETLFSPLRGALEGKRQLLLSPDSQLHRVPFSALALLAGSTPSLPTTITLHTIGSGRDLVTATGQPPPTSASLVLANPATTGWARLARAASEGQAVAASLSTKPLLGSAASVAVLERARGPHVLHVAGHGYFDPKATGDPLLASGLALAGADKARQPSRQISSQATAIPTAPNPQSSAPSPAPSGSPLDDGYLTAKEAARLQLEGTDLVVLSACESGLGSERSGEGLFGLRRALTVAGARGTLLSLWKVPEHATETFMTRFYALLRQGITPAEAVRRVQAEFRAQPRIDGWSDPFYWAGWQYSGLSDPPR